jgi:hypothetical protein
LYEEATNNPSRDDFFLQEKQTRPSGVVARSQRGQTCSSLRGILARHSSHSQTSGLPQPMQEMGKRVSKIKVFVFWKVLIEFKAQSPARNASP